MKLLKSIGLILLLTFFAGVALVSLSGCETDARIASRNMSKAADMFEIDRRIVFYNTWKDVYMLSIEGKCSLEHGKRVAVTCKVGPNSFKKHYVTLSGQVSVFTEQLESIGASVYHYRVIFKPQTILPNLDFEGGKLGS